MEGEVHGEVRAASEVAALTAAGHIGDNPLMPNSPRLRRPLLAACLLASLVLPAHAQSVPTEAPVSRADRQAELTVEKNLQRAPELQEVEAEVAGGVATLSGQVPTQPDRKQAGQIAADARGVEQVNNRIALDPDLKVRFASAMEEVKAKLVRLVANLPLLLVAILIVMLAVWLGGFLSRRLRFLKRLGGRNPYMEGLVRNILQWLVTLGGVLLALDLLGATSLVSAVLGSAGVVGLVLGFAFKDIAENYIAGILLSIRRPFSPGDLVKIDAHEGRVVALNSRATQLMTLDGNHLLLPNSLVFKSVMLNFSRNPKRRFEFSTNIATGRSWHDAMDRGIETLRGIDGVLDDPAPSALIETLSNDSATLRFMGWINQHENDLAKTRSEAMRLVRHELRSAGLTPPDGVQRILLSRGDEVDAKPESDTGKRRDTSVDRALDAQLRTAGDEAEDGADLLQPVPPTAKP